MTGEHPVEGAVGERQRRARRRYERGPDGSRDGAISTIDCALVEPDGVRRQMAGEEAGAAGDVERAPAGSAATTSTTRARSSSQTGAVAGGEESLAGVPVVVLGGARLVVLLQSASCWYAIDWNDSRCSGETPSFSIAARCSGVE